MTTATLPEHRKAYGAIHFSVRAYGVQVVGLAYDDGLAGGDGNVTPKTELRRFQRRQRPRDQLFVRVVRMPSRHEPCAQPCRGETR